MSRSGYSDDCEHLNLWRSNVERTIAGKRGQSFFKEMIKALEEMPIKRLIKESLKAGEEVCALGAVGLKRGIDMRGLDPEDPAQVANAFSISEMLAQEIVYKNDDQCYSLTPEQRWTEMHRWAKKCLQDGQA